MQKYLDLVKNVLENGTRKNDRTLTGTISFFGTQTRYNLGDGFPLLTTKKIYFQAVVVELLWFISGDTNIKYLVDNKVNIWNEWPYEIYKKSNDYQGEDLQTFVDKIRTDNDFAKLHGDLGPVYGKQWRNFNGVDQLADLIFNLKNNPDSRRHIISAWNPEEVSKMALPPCHTIFQFYVSGDKKLNLQLYQRSGDIFLGVPFNIASYSLLLILIANEVGLEPGEFVHTIGDAHIYQNHLEQIELQLSRIPKKLPSITLKDSNVSIFDLKPDDIILENYESYPGIKGKVAV
ncbi:thymidylate synthase [Spiroplasma alleghenense]|uniref:Thymidylate synthase n=1 Tax=Spiroplasma alleghenense TaxID=216931 RepID=A0A345Z3V0_9MOLU|nr:thymidylate synthase [Spiroplasma alleghenense]AXK51279.1 thymidylate synthase [Spiroplasma alleghenense]